MFLLSIFSEVNMEIVTNELPCHQKIVDTLLVYTIKVM